MVVSPDDHALTDELNDLLRHPKGRDTDVADIWARYLRDKNKADFDRLCLHYMPLVWIAANRFIRQKPEASLSNTVSDGLLGLVSAIAKAQSFRPGGNHSCVDFWIERQIWREFRGRLWGKQHVAEKLIVIQPIRRALIEKLGRRPTRDEMIEALSARVKNVAPYLPCLNDEEREVSLFADSDKRKIRRMAGKPDKSLDGMVANEAFAVALKGTAGLNRKILKLALEGHKPPEIARRLRIGYQSAWGRLMDIRKSLLSRADVVKYFGIKRETADVAVA